MDEAFLEDARDGVLSSPGSRSQGSHDGELVERFSRKVFVGGLPPDIDEGNLVNRRVISEAFSFMRAHLIITQMLPASSVYPSI